MARILVIDDDPSLLRALRLALGATGHTVTTASRAGEGLSQFVHSSPELVVLDLGLPDGDGLSVLTRIRQTSDVPIIVLSAADAENRKVAALDAGADDYVTKPFGMAELDARVRTALRHHGTDANQPPPEPVTVGPLHLDPIHHETVLSGRQIDLTAKEFDVLYYLARHQGKVCTHQMILSAVWGNTYGREAQYLHAYVHRLRQKLGTTDGVAIRTAPGIGYVLEENDATRRS